MVVGEALHKHDEQFFSVVFKVNDKEAFAPERRRLCLGMTLKGEEPTIPGAQVTAVSCGSFASYTSYSDYLLAYIDAKIDKSRDPPLTFSEWLENKTPKKHDKNKEYVYLED